MCLRSMSVLMLAASAAAEQVDVVVDACDNFTTRFAVNAAAIQVG